MSSYKCGWKIHERPPTGGHMVLRINLFQIPFLFFPTTNQIGERPNFFDPGTIHQTPSSDPVSYFLNLSKKKFLMILIISKNICQTLSDPFAYFPIYLPDSFWSFWMSMKIFVWSYQMLLNIPGNICQTLSDVFEYFWMIRPPEVQCWKKVLIFFCCKRFKFHF